MLAAMNSLALIISYLFPPRRWAQGRPGGKERKVNTATATNLQQPTGNFIGDPQKQARLKHGCGNVKDGLSGKRNK